MPNMNILRWFFGTKQDRDIKQLLPRVKQINALESTIKKMTDEELQAQTFKFKNLLIEGKTLDDILPEAFATVREASWRILGMRPFDVQLMGGLVLHQGKIAEMKTGEGKTLCATMPLYLNALSGKGVHLVTVNDYLAQRDARDMGVLYNWLGLSVGCIIADMDDEDRQKAYTADITYGTNNEFAFDYLRDNMKFRLENFVQRVHNFCIVDEVDSILIDEARTPLLISGPSEGEATLYTVANKIVRQLNKTQHYTVDEKARTAMLTDEGVVRIQEILNVPNLFEMKHVTLLHHIHQSLKAWTLFKKDVDYVVKEDGKVIIVDEFTGRLKEGSRWSDGLHQSVEAKENVPIKSENQTLASITFQNYFRLYAKLAGMTGTADTEAEEFRKIYSLEVCVVPTNMPMVRADQADIIFKTKNAKYEAVSKLIKELHIKGQPVLVGTISIDNSELLSGLLDKAGVKHNVLNAKQHENEAHIVATAGEKGSVTIATNMAGRGTDIKLTNETRQFGLYIVGTERHEARRIDNQLRGRSGRQGDPGESKFFLSLEDDLMRIFGSDRIKNIMSRMGMKDDEPIEHRMITNAIAKAQKKVEGHNFDIRKHLLDYDNVMNEQRKVIYHLRKEILNNSGNMELAEQMIEDVVEMLLVSYRPQGRVSASAWPWIEMVSGFRHTFHTQFEINLKECDERFASDIEAYWVHKAKDLLSQKFQKYDPEQVTDAVREILLGIIDKFWKDHLLNMDHLKEGIGLKAYAQQDPLNAYKREAFHLFETMKTEVKKAVVYNIFGVELYTSEEIEELRRQQEAFLKAQMEAHQRAKEAEANATSSSSGNQSGQPKKTPTLTRNNEKVGRNDACPCGSGKKYKHCHGV